MAFLFVTSNGAIVESALMFDNYLILNISYSLMNIQP
jgi:hypothetical protein